MLNALHSPRSVRIVGVLDDDSRLRGRSVAGYPVLGQLADADRLIEEFRIHGIEITRLILALPDVRSQREALSLVAG